MKTLEQRINEAKENAIKSNTKYLWLIVAEANADEYFIKWHKENGFYESIADEVETGIIVRVVHGNKKTSEKSAQRSVKTTNGNYHITKFMEVSKIDETYK